MKKILQILTIPALYSGLSSCSSGLNAYVTTYSELPPQSTFSDTVNVTVKNKGVSSLQKTLYKTPVYSELEKIGLQQSSKSKGYKMDVLTGIEKVVKIPYSDPIYGTTSSSTTYHTGSAYTYGSGYSSTTHASGTSYTPSKTEVVGYQTGSINNYVHFAKLRLKDKSGKSIWEAQVKATSASTNTERLAPYMLRAAFKDFPGVHGKVRRVYQTQP